MSLGIKSIWKARMRCAAPAGPAMISRVSAAPRISPRISSPVVQIIQKSQFGSTSADSADRGTRSAYDRPTRPPNESRGRQFKDAYFMQLDSVNFEKASRLHRAMIGRPRSYPDRGVHKECQQELYKDLIRQLGHENVWNRFHKRVPGWTQCLNLMKRLTPVWSDRTSMSAVRVVLPQEMDVEVGNSNLEYLDSVTGVLRRLRSSVDKSTKSIVLRGESTVLTRAADELVSAYPACRVYQLGEVSSFDYTAKQLWPAIEGSLDEGDSIPDDQKSMLWMHKEQELKPLLTRYEDVPRPETWDQESFETYINTFLFSRILPTDVISVYGKLDTWYGRNIDTDGIWTGLLVAAFKDPGAQRLITAPLLRKAVSILSFKGGYRASAYELVQLGEKYGIPMDTDMYNIMLEGYVAKKDLAFFAFVLRRMKMLYLRPNTRTWILFLRLIGGEDERRQIIVGMFDLGMFNHKATRLNIASAMASMDAYAAFRVGKSLTTFQMDQRSMYGPDWLTASAAHDIVTELLRFNTDGVRLEECKTLIKAQINAGIPLETETLNTVLKFAAAWRDWSLATWTLSQMEGAGLEADKVTHQHLTNLAIHTHASEAFGVLFFCGALTRRHYTPTRKALHRIFTGKGDIPHWRQPESSPRIATPQILAPLTTDPIVIPRNIVARLERLILENYGDYVPAQGLSVMLEAVLPKTDVAREVDQGVSSKPEQEPAVTPGLDGASSELAGGPVFDSSTIPPAQILLRPREGKGESIMVSLTSSFDLDTMVKPRDWNDEPEPVETEKPDHVDGDV